MVRGKKNKLKRQAAKDLVPYLDAALALKKVKRAGWVAKAGIADAESVADHTFSMCAAGMALADMMGLDTEKVLKMVVLHDLAESVVGDYMPGQVAAKEKADAEDAAMSKILTCLPAEVRAEYRGIWQEFLAGRTRTARFVHRLDKLEMALQAARYAKEGHDEKLLQQFFDSAARAIVVTGDGNNSRKKGEEKEESDDLLLVEILKSLNRARPVKK
ncbi:HD domain-containing protein [Nitrososphaera sp.]|uniref:HD domain-containing protein n=1 Tax=Nitrososphaera sp. TaxID=1971748 RepID=UPI00307D99E1